MNSHSQRRRSCTSTNNNNAGHCSGIGGVGSVMSSSAGGESVTSSGRVTTVSCPPSSEAVGSAGATGVGLHAVRSNSENSAGESTTSDVAESLA